MTDAFDRAAEAWAMLRDAADQNGVEIPWRKDFVYGGIVGVAEIVDCVEEASESPWFFGPWGFVLRGVRPVAFVPVSGALGFFDWRKRLKKEIGHG